MSKIAISNRSRNRLHGVLCICSLLHLAFFVKRERSRESRPASGQNNSWPSGRGTAKHSVFAYACSSKNSATADKPYCAGLPVRSCCNLPQPELSAIPCTRAVLSTCPPAIPASPLGLKNYSKSSNAPASWVPLQPLRVWWPLTATRSR